MRKRVYITSGVLVILTLCILCSCSYGLQPAAVSSQAAEKPAAESLVTFDTSSKTSSDAASSEVSSAPSSETSTEISSEVSSEAISSSSKAVSSKAASSKAKTESSKAASSKAASSKPVSSQAESSKSSVSTSKEPFLYLLYNASINTEKKITVNGPDTCKITGVQVNGVEDTDASSATTDVSYDKATFSFKASAKGRYSIQVSVENPSTGNIYDLTTTIVVG